MGPERVRSVGGGEQSGDGDGERGGEGGTEKGEMKEMKSEDSPVCVFFFL